MAAGAFSTGGGAPRAPQRGCRVGDPARSPRAIADASPRIRSPRLGMAAGAFPLAAGPHGHPNAAAALGTPPGRRALSLMPRLGFAVLGSAWPQALFYWRGPPGTPNALPPWGPPP